MGHHILIELSSVCCRRWALSGQAAVSQSTACLLELSTPDSYRCGRCCRPPGAPSLCSTKDEGSLRFRRDSFGSLDVPDEVGWRAQCLVLNVSLRINGGWCFWVQSKALRPLAKEWLQQIPMGRLAEVADLQVKSTASAR